MPTLAPAPDTDAGTTPFGERRRGPERRRVSDRRSGPRERRRGRRDRRPVPVERRQGADDRRSGRRDRRLGGDRRKALRVQGPPPVDPDVLFWAVNVTCWAAVTAVAVIWGL